MNATFEPSRPPEEKGWYLAYPRRLLHEWSEYQGQRILTLHYGEKEICFDDARDLAFGEGLLANERFRLSDATSWGEGYSAEEITAYTDLLVAEEVLVVQGTVASTPPQPSSRRTTRPQALRGTWSATQTGWLAREIFGVESAELGHLELLVSGWQAAQSLVDRDGVQLGDLNVYPPELCQGYEAEHKQCRYPGSRHEHVNPMNVTGLRMVRCAWPDAVGVLRKLKQNFVARRASPDAPLTIAELFTLSVCVLSLPTVMHQRAVNPVQSGSFPSSIAALFRIIDGTRLASRAMMLLDEARWTMDWVPTPEAFYFYCDQKGLLINEGAGVCAGPPELITRFLEEVSALPPPQGEISDALFGLLGDLDQVIDYGCASLAIELTLDLLDLHELDLAHALLEDLEQDPGVPAELLGALTAATRSENLSILLKDLPATASRASVRDQMRRVLGVCRAVCGIELPAEPTHWGAPDSAAVERHLRAARTEELPQSIVRRLAVALAGLDALEATFDVRLEATMERVNRILGRKIPDTFLEAPVRPRSSHPRSLRRALESALCPAFDEERGPEVPQLRPTSSVQMETLRRMFVRARYSLRSITTRGWSTTLETELEAARTLPTLKQISGGWPWAGEQPASVPDLLTRLFFCSLQVSEETFTRLLTTQEQEVLLASGLVERNPRGRVICPAFAVTPIDGLYVVTDMGATVEQTGTPPTAGGANALVMPGYLETYVFAARTHRHPVSEALDVCTGGGVHALLGRRFSQRSMGTDISARAIEIARFNARLNQLDVLFEQGSTFDAIGSRRFDRITANPPYQPDSSSRPGENWWGAGPRGDGVVRELIGNLPDHLNVDGEFQMVGRFFEWEGRPLESALRAWLGEHADRFSIAFDTDPESIEEVRASYPNEPLRGLTSVMYGVITLRRLH